MIRPLDIPEDVYGPDAFRREDESDDRRFYARDRFVPHLDSRALAAVEAVVGTLVVEKRPAILDLMAGWDSHLPESVRPSRASGLGLNRNEMRENQSLDGGVLHDLNADPRLPFADASFDVVLNVVSVDYLVRPFDVFGEVGRVLRPGGLFLVIFSTRMFPSKAVEVWRDADERERILIVEDFFRASGSFERPRSFVWQGRPRPEDDRYADVEPQSDPIFAVWADRAGGDPDRAARARPVVEWPAPWDEDEVRSRTERIGETLACPHCGEPLLAWDAPDGPFAEWDATTYHICFNDGCPFYVRSWDAMARGGNLGFSCRLLYHRERDRIRPIPVNGPTSLRAGIRDA